MDSQKKGSPQLSLPLSQWLRPERPDDTLIAWRKDQQWLLKDLRHDVTALIEKINATIQTRWALCFEDPYAFIAALLAVLYCGRTPVLPGHCRQALLLEQQTEFDALLTDLPLEISCPVIRFPFAFQPEQTNAKRQLPEWQSGLSLVMFTSGSTGTPQKVIKPVACLEQESRWLAQHWGDHSSRTRLVSTVAHHHLYGLTFSIVMPLSLGLPIYSSRLEYHEQLVALAQEYDLTLIGSPAFLQRLDTRLPAVGCRQVISAGGPLHVEAALRAQRCCGVLPMEIYGTTETGVIGYRQQSQRDTPWERFAEVTFITEGADTVIVKSALIPEPQGIELNDHITLLAGQSSFHLGSRKDRVVNIAEQRISLSDIELRLSTLSALREASVLILNKRGRDYVATLIVLSETGYQQYQTLGQAAFLAALRQQLRQWLTPVAIPRFWRIATDIPVNAQGKRAYAEIRELFL